MRHLFADGTNYFVELCLLSLGLRQPPVQNRFFELVAQMGFGVQLDRLQDFLFKLKFDFGALFEHPDVLLLVPREEPEAQPSDSQVNFKIVKLYDSDVEVDGEENGENCRPLDSQAKLETHFEVKNQECEDIVDGQEDGDCDESVEYLGGRQHVGSFNLHVALG